MHDDLSSTIYLLCNIIGDNIFIKDCGSSCGANILGRFGHIDSSIEHFSKEITTIDQHLNSNMILAEVVHMPGSREGNVLLRPKLRDYEIHYLTKPCAIEEFRIPLSDIMVSLKNDKITLQSKRLGKEIIPRITTSFNHTINTLPAYRFLGELQFNDMRKAIFFKWGRLFSDFTHYPRVEYKNFILSRESWLVEAESFPQSDNNLNSYLEEKHIPQCVVIPDDDNEQYIDFNDPNCVAIFREMINKRKSIIVEEFLFDSGESPVKDNSGGRYCNEFIFVCHKQL
jgi:hypothetical protein